MKLVLLAGVIAMLLDRGGTAFIAFVRRQRSASRSARRGGRPHGQAGHAHDGRLILLSCALLTFAVLIKRTMPG